MASMKLRVRAATGGPTLKVQVPLLCNLQGLKEVLGPLISLPASSFSLSLNKKDDIQGPGTTLLSSVGITSGDLLFYIVNSSGSSSLILPSGSPSSRVAGSATPTESTGPGASVLSIDGLAEIPTRGRAASTPSTRRELCAAAAARRAAANLATEQEGEISTAGSDSTTLNQQTIAGGSDVMASAGLAISPSSSVRATLEVRSGMDLEADEAGPPEMPPPRPWGHRLVPIPDLLQRVLNTEFENIRQPSMSLVLAVHSVMLETGFLRIETRGTNTRKSVEAESRTVEGYELPSGWSSTGLVNLSYTLPELSGLGTARGLGQEALLRCQIVGNAVVVYGAVTGGSVNRVSLSVSKFLHENLKLPKLGAAGATSTSGGESVMEGVEAAGDGAQVVAAASMGENIFSCIFELWKEVKDSLSLPLLTYMCEATGLPPPPSLLRLPTELKIKVLDLLPSLALANLACSCSEFRFLTSSEELWKQKYKEDFGACGERAPGGRGWKSAFVREFEHRRRREAERSEAERRFLAEVFTPGVIMRPPAVYSTPNGDYLYGMGGDPPQYNLPRGLRMRRTPSVNFGGPFPFIPVPTPENMGGFCFPPFEFEGHGERRWPPVNVPGTREPRYRYGRSDGDDLGDVGLPMRLPSPPHRLH